MAKPTEIKENGKTVVISSALEVSEASGELRKQALAECGLPDKSLRELIERGGEAHEDSKRNDGGTGPSSNK